MTTNQWAEAIGDRLNLLHNTRHAIDKQWIKRGRVDLHVAGREDRGSNNREAENPMLDEA